MRHGALNDTAKKLGCNVVALGHHSDDAVETVFLNMFYAGRIACFNPVTELDRTGLRLIRPMLYISEKTTARVARKLELPVSHNPCPANGNSKRQHIKEMLAQQAREDKLIPRRLQAAVKALWRQHL
jgi:tRNA(Ile)-lysidine synthase TilS/MesJ